MSYQANGPAAKRLPFVGLAVSLVVILLVGLIPPTLADSGPVDDILLTEVFQQDLGPYDSYAVKAVDTTNVYVAYNRGEWVVHEPEDDDRDPYQTRDDTTGEVWIAQTPDAGANWTRKLVTDNAGYVRNLAIDVQSSSIYVSWLDAFSTNLTIAVSHDDGQTWHLGHAQTPDDAPIDPSHLTMQAYSETEASLFWREIGVCRGMERDPGQPGRHWETWTSDGGTTWQTEDIAVFTDKSQWTPTTNGTLRPAAGIFWNKCLEGGHTASRDDSGQWTHAPVPSDPRSIRGLPDVAPIGHQALVADMEVLDANESTHELAVYLPAADGSYARRVADAGYLTDPPAVYGLDRDHVALTYFSMTPPENGSASGDPWSWNLTLATTADGGHAWTRTTLAAANISTQAVASSSVHVPTTATAFVAYTTHGWPEAYDLRIVRISADPDLIWVPSVTQTTALGPAGSADSTASDLDGTSVGQSGDAVQPGPDDADAQRPWTLVLVVLVVLGAASWGSRRIRKGPRNRR